jgi:hypothetical protein
MTGAAPGTITLRTAIAASVCAAAINAIYVVADTEPAPLLSTFVSFGPVVTTVLWLHQDARRHKIAEVLDFGWFFMMFWIFVVPWYAFKSRGRAGWRLLIGLVALIVLPALTRVVLTWALGRQG